MSVKLTDIKLSLIEEIIDKKCSLPKELVSELKELLLDIQILNKAKDKTIEKLNSQILIKSWVDVIKKSYGSGLPKNADICTLNSSAIANINGTVIEGRVKSITERGISIKTTDKHIFVKWCNVLEII